MDSLFAALRYGSLGLSAILAVLAFRLLQTEQKVEKPRPALLRAIRSFFIVALVLALIGAGTELLSKRQPTGDGTPQDFSTWTVTGRYEVPDPGAPIKPVITVSPLLQGMNTDGTFWTVIPVQRGTPGAALALTVDPQGAYLPEIIHLGSRVGAFDKGYRVAPDSANHVLTITDTIRFTKAIPYTGAH